MKNIQINIDKTWVLLISIVLGAVVFTLIRNRYFKKKLEGIKIEAFAIVLKSNSGGVRSPAGVSYYYFVNGMQYSNEVAGHYEFMKRGDTLLIEYALSDPSVSQVKDKYYMNKYSHLKDVE